MISDKKLAKILKILGPDTIGYLDILNPEMLKDQVIASEHAINEAVRELEANPKYTELKESLKALSSGLREVKARQNSIIQYALNRLENQGVK